MTLAFVKICPECGYEWGDYKYWNGYMYNKQNERILTLAYTCPQCKKDINLLDESICKRI